VPENGTVAPLLMANEPTASDPVADVCVAIVQWTFPVEAPAGAALMAPNVPASAAPALLMEHALTTTLEVPELVRMRVQVPLVLLQSVTWAATCAELVNDPNRPKTNPAMAMAAMRVMAIRITVAKTGEIAFLLLGLLSFILGYPSYDQTPENGTDAPLLIEREPIASEPIAGSPVAALVVHVGPVSVAPAVTVSDPVPAAGVEVTAIPPACIEQPWIRTFEVPVLVRVRVHTSLPPTMVQDVTLAET